MPGVEIVSTGSTAGTLAAAGLPVTPVEQVTGFPECLDGRVKTLHPHIHAGLLADLRLESHRTQLTELGIEPFQLVVSNLYPFTQTVASGAGAGRVRRADRHRRAVDGAGGGEEPPVGGDHHLPRAVRAGDRSARRRRASPSLPRKALAAAAFVHTATYDVAVASWMGSVLTDSSGGDGFPAWVGATWDKAGTLRYGENSHQRAALYRNGYQARGLATAEQLHGKEMSYNNYTDGDAAYRAAYDFSEPAVAIIKHANPCGIAVGADIAEAHRKAHACDPVSAYGGVIATNRPISVEAAKQIAEIFTEVVIAPGYEDGALEVLQAKKNLRRPALPSPIRPAGVEMKSINGGLLLQAADAIDAPGDDPANWQLVSGDAADAATLADLEFAWRACRAVKSNAILLASGGASVGVGMGQVNRVDSCKLAVERAGERAAGSVAASDAFFPFNDGPAILIEAGVKAIVQPGGSVRDADTIAAAQAAGVTMYFTGTRHFFH